VVDILIRVNHTTEAPTQYWRIYLYYPFLDHLITERELRLLTTENRFHAQHLPSRAVDQITNNYVASIYEAYQADIDLSLEDSRREVARWGTSWVITKRNDLSTFCTREILYQEKFCTKRNFARRNNTVLGPEDRLKLLSKLWLWVENTKKNNNEKIKIKCQWGPSEIHVAFLGSSGPVPMYWLTALS
jgi:hypothetical protein